MATVIYFGYKKHFPMNFSPFQSGGRTQYCKTRNVGGFANITIWLRFNLEILLEESGWGSIVFFHLVTTNLGEID